MVLILKIRKIIFCQSLIEDLVIYAAPNNGPYQVLNFIILNQEKIKKKIIISFNLSVDIFRLSPDYNIQNYVKLREDQLNDIIEKPFKYRLIILKSLITNKIFTISERIKNAKSFLIKILKIKKNLDIYFENLNEIINKLDIEVDYILTMPYWIYEKNKNNKNFFVNSNLEDKLKTLVCKTFQKNNKLQKKYISILNDIINSHRG